MQVQDPSPKNKHSATTEVWIKLPWIDSVRYFTIYPYSYIVHLIQGICQIKSLDQFINTWKRMPQEFDGT
jgi:hypothetical protein